MDQATSLGGRAGHAIRIDFRPIRLTPVPVPTDWVFLVASTGIEAAKAVGKLIAERAKTVNVSSVVFDRGGRMYHGRIKALADASREGGLQF